MRVSHLAIDPEKRKKKIIIRPRPRKREKSIRKYIHIAARAVSWRERTAIRCSRDIPRELWARSRLDAQFTDDSACYRAGHTSVNLRAKTLNLPAVPAAVKSRGSAHLSFARRTTLVAHKLPPLERSEAAVRPPARSRFMGARWLDNSQQVAGKRSPTPRPIRL